MQDSKKTTTTERVYAAAIEQVLVRDGMGMERAKELAHNIAEVMPDFDQVVAKIKDGKLEYQDILKLIVHVPYHVEEMVRLWRR